MAEKIAPRPPNTAYDEITHSIFSLGEFEWREVSLRAAPSLLPAKKSEGQLGGEAARTAGKAGGFRYNGSSLCCSLCRNRFILW